MIPHTLNYPFFITNLVPALQCKNRASLALWFLVSIFQNMSTVDWLASRTQLASWLVFPLSAVGYRPHCLSRTQNLHSSLHQIAHLYLACNQSIKFSRSFCKMKQKGTWTSLEILQLFAWETMLHNFL